VASEPPSNHLLDLLDADARAALSPVAVQLRSREVLYEPGLPALYAYFPVGCVIALVSMMENGASPEVAVVGREGMVGLAGALGTVEGTTAAVVQIGGTALRVPTAVLRRERVRSSSVRTVIDLYTEARLIQVAQLAACNRLHPVERRLARWLLAVADRIGDEYFTLSQDFMAQMLGVHRPTVSSTLHRLRDAGVIAYRGRAVAVANRAGLERLACECYGVLRREYDRLLLRPVNGLATLPRVLESSATQSDGSGSALETLREVSGRLLLASIREQEARDEAEAANKAKDHFLAMVSHELRTPLNAIVGWSTILVERPDDAPQRGLKVIQRNAQALLKLVEELLDAARLTAGTMSIQPASLNLRDVVCSAVDAVKPAADLKGVALRTSVPDTFPRMTGDPDRLRQVFLNVLSNAIKFTDAGGAIDVGAGVTGQSASVSVHDTGNGIAADELPHVFERFRQGADTTAGQRGLGLGLGLTIARVLVELHGGTIQIASPGVRQGTTCTIDLPIAESVAESLLRATGTEM
jgi:signal transduction histidine kinase